MLRTIAAALCALLLCSGGLLAEEIKGKVKSLDADKGVITITVGDKDQEIKIGEGTKFVGPAGREIKDGLKAPVFKRANLQVVVTTEKKDGKEEVKEVKIDAQIRQIKPIQIKPIQIKPVPPGQPQPMPIKPIQIRPIQPKPGTLPVVPPEEEKKKDF